MHTTTFRNLKASYGGRIASILSQSQCLHSYLRVPTLASHTRRCHVDGSYVTGSRHVLLALCQGKDSWHISVNIIPPVLRSIWQNMETFSKVFTPKYYDALSITPGNAMDFRWYQTERQKHLHLHVCIALSVIWETQQHDFISSEALNSDTRS